MGRERAEPGERREHRPVLEHCGVDVDRFEQIVDQNNYGEAAYPEDDEE